MNLQRTHKYRHTYTWPHIHIHTLSQTVDTLTETYACTNIQTYIYKRTHLHSNTHTNTRAHTNFHKRMRGVGWLKNKNNSKRDDMGGEGESNGQ